MKKRNVPRGKSKRTSIAAKNGGEARKGSGQFTRDNQNAAADRKLPGTAVKAGRRGKLELHR